MESIPTHQLSRRGDNKITAFSSLKKKRLYSAVLKRGGKTPSLENVGKNAAKKHPGVSKNLPQKGGMENWKRDVKFAQAPPERDWLNPIIKGQKRVKCL